MSMKRYAALLQIDEGQKQKKDRVTTLRSSAVVCCQCSSKHCMLQRNSLAGAEQCLRIQCNKV
jgi:hypothetical protein